MKRYVSLPLVCCLSVLLFSAGCERGSSNTQTKETAEVAVEQADPAANVAQENDFLLNAYSYGLMLAQYSRLAAEKAGAPAVKSFAEQSAAWHSSLNQEIAKLAHEQGISLPDSAGTDVQNYAAELQALPSADFELRYLEVLQDIQQKNLSLFTEAAENTADTTMSTWASQKTVDLQAHAQAVQELSDQLKAQ